MSKDENNIDKKLANISMKDSEELNLILMELRSRVVRMESALLGNEEMGSTGFVKRYELTEQQTRTNTDRLNKIYWFAALIGGISSVFITIIASLIKILFL